MALANVWCSRQIPDQWSSPQSSSVIWQLSDTSVFSNHQSPCCHMSFLFPAINNWKQVVGETNRWQPSCFLSGQETHISLWAANNMLYASSFEYVTSQSVITPVPKYIQCIRQNSFIISCIATSSFCQWVGPHPGGGTVYTTARPQCLNARAGISKHSDLHCK